MGVMADAAPAAVAPPFTVSDCEVRAMPNGVKAVLRPVTAAMPAQTDWHRLVATLHAPVDCRERAFWAHKWHFAASERELLQMLDDALREDEIQF